MSDLQNKFERLSAGLYLVTSFFDDREPIKWRLRVLSTNLVSEEIKDKPSVIKDIVSILSVAKTSRLVSETNYDILVKEFSKLETPSNSLEGLFNRNTSVTEIDVSKTPRLEHIKDNILESKNIEKPALKEFGAVSVKKNNRQSVIINILKRKKEIMIKDVTPLISGCSEKTIQRELSSMVERGLLKKVGEKRWSRYSLA